MKLHQYIFGALIGCLVFLPGGSAFGASQAEVLRDLQYKVSALQAYADWRTKDHGSPALSNADLHDITTAGTQWLIAAQEDNGHFKYEYNPYSDRYLAGDNIVRQAGALYQLGEVVRRDADRNPALAQAIEESISYFETLSEEDEYAGTSFRCITESERSNRCKLGATALAFIGILSYVEAYPELASEYEDLISEYHSFITASRNPDAGFRYIHIVGESDDEQDTFESSFSNGEALLALVRYYQFNPTPETMAVIDEAYVYLSEESAERFDSPLYLWIMAALKDLQVIAPKPEYVSYAELFTLERMNAVGTRKQTTHNYCAYAEGIAAAYDVLKDGSTAAMITLVDRELDYWNKKNSRLQVTNADHYRVAMRDNDMVFLKVDDMEQAAGGFLTAFDTPTQRIDFTQHCIHAYLQELVDINGESFSSVAE
ncbi:hypothetical protein N9L26_02240 [Candidatus Pacebacteria bacterium]|nr:hypothetical protein [Candidatus Paceibacterota bacterium]